MNRHIIKMVTVFALPLAFCLAGCGNPHGLRPVDVTVLLDGQPAEGISVTFVPEDSAAGLGGGGVTDAKGKCSVTTTLGTGGDGTKAGKYLMKFVKTAPQREYTPKELELLKDEATAEKVPKIPLVNLIPERYGSPKTSGITAEIKDHGSNTFVFELSSK